MDETYAYFAVVGPGRADPVTAHLGLSPSRSWNEGDARPRGGTPYTAMKWFLESGLGRDRPFEEHLHALLPILEGRSAQIRSLPAPYESILQLVAYYRSTNPGIYLEAEVVARIAELGLEIDFDIYCLGSRDDG